MMSSCTMNNQQQQYCNLYSSFISHEILILNYVSNVQFNNANQYLGQDNAYLHARTQRAFPTQSAHLQLWSSPCFGFRIYVGCSAAVQTSVIYCANLFYLTLMTYWNVTALRNVTFIMQDF